MTLTIHCLKVDRPNRGCPYVIVYDWSGWPARSLIVRGWHRSTIVYVRQATPAEVAEWRQSRRCVAYRYQTWPQLAEDEAAYGLEANELAATWREQQNTTKPQARVEFPLF